MKRILIDTNAYTTFKQGEAEAIEILRIPDFIGISTVVLGELLAGFAVGSKESLNRNELKMFLASPRVYVLPVDTATTAFYAQVYKQLRDKGRPIPTNDLWIAATAFQHGCALFTYDKHFAEVEGLRYGCRVHQFTF